MKAPKSEKPELRSPSLHPHARDGRSLGRVWMEEEEEEEERGGMLHVSGSPGEKGGGEAKETAIFSSYLSCLGNQQPFSPSLLRIPLQQVEASERGSLPPSPPSVATLTRPLPRSLPLSPFDWSPYNDMKCGGGRAGGGDAD